MKTRLLSVTSEADMQEAAKIIADGGLVAFPTETVYGLGADALNARAVGSVYDAKGRPSDNPMIVHVCRADDLKRIYDLDKLPQQNQKQIRALTEKFWPGPLTIIGPRAACVPDRTTGGLETVAVRMPDSQVALDLRQSGCPIAAPSANLSGRPSPTRAKDVVADMDGRIEAIFMGGDCQVGIESTVLDMTGDTPTILRPGILTADDISDALGVPVAYDKALSQKPDGADFKPKAPGMKYKHYAPKADMMILEGAYTDVKREIERLRREKEREGLKVGSILFEESAFREAAHDFFARLRDLDQAGVDLIIAGALSGEDQVGFAVMNRMVKSAGYNIIKVREREEYFMKIAIASDHGGYQLKEEIKKYLEGRNIEVVDLGTNSEESVDYPIYGKACGEAVMSGTADRGIVCCGTGIGISIAANKVKGIRCALCTDVHMAEMSRKHNDSNVLSLGGRTTPVDKALEIVGAWLDTEFEGGRHQRRVDMLNA